MLHDKDNWRAHAHTVLGEAAMMSLVRTLKGAYLCQSLAGSVNICSVLLCRHGEASRAVRDQENAARVLAVQGKGALVDAVQVPQHAVVRQHLGLLHGRRAIAPLAVVQLGHVHAGIAGNRPDGLCTAKNGVSQMPASLTSGDCSHLQTPSPWRSHSIKI